MLGDVVLRTEVPGFPCYRGKVRDVYDLGETLAIVATDRISAFDWVLSTGIPGKGRILTTMTLFWFRWLGVPNHVLSADLTDLPSVFQTQAEVFRGRTMRVRKTKVIPFECVARGFLLGTGWKEYQRTGSVCGIPLPVGLREADRLSQPLFTPATKAELGDHDENISFEQMAVAIGQPLADELRSRTLDVYQRAAAYAEQRGVLIADTKLEWGQLPTGERILIDEVLTPDSSRFWPADRYRPGQSPVSFDKQYLRDWLETTDWDKSSPPPELPPEVVAQTAQKYQEALDRLTA